MRIDPPAPTVTTSLRAVAADALVMSIRVMSVPMFALGTRPRPVKVAPAGNPVPPAIAVLNWVAGAGEGMAAVSMPALALLVPSPPEWL